ncbi:hypothetical protein MKEN_00576500 [Mycena kentingensis (nom. inval.)]|nr:hypothetical protein MKEN_00576500 [Mycena kentingensis (nom. inval.)]
MSPLFALIAAASLAAAAAAAAVPQQDDWKIALGWNQTTLPAASVGSSVGAFTPPASFGAVKAVKAVSLAVTASVGKPGGVFLCGDVNWKGICGYSVQPLNECILLADPWLKAVSSFGPDPGATCFAFASGNCDAGEAEWSFDFPGDDSGGLATTNAWNDKITSFACVSS